MSAEFEVITITLSFVLGLGMTHLLWSTASAVRARRELELHWLPFVWAASIFLQHVSFFPSALSIDLAIQSWSWSWYLHVLAMGVLLFAAGALVLPSEAQQRVGSLLEDFQVHGRLALLPFAAYQLAWFPTNYRIDGSIFGPANYANVILVSLAIVGFMAQRKAVQAGAALGFFTLLVASIAFFFGFTSALPG